MTDFNNLTMPTDSLAAFTVQSQSNGTVRASLRATSGTTYTLTLSRLDAFTVADRLQTACTVMANLPRGTPTRAEGAPAWIRVSPDQSGSAVRVDLQIDQQWRTFTIGPFHASQLAEALRSEAAGGVVQTFAKGRHAAGHPVLLL